MDDKNIKSIINVLLEAGRQHKRSASMHRKQSVACMRKATELKLLLSTKGADKSHGH
jgi:hypothetical protein